MRLALGTVQLGMNYGIANRSGQPDLDHATEIVSAALNGGIRCLDTAQAYGDSESVLGKVLKRLGKPDDLRIVSKLPRLRAEEPDYPRRSLEQTLERLGVDNIECFMLHREEDLELLGSEMLGNFQSLPGTGLVGKIGISLYSPDRTFESLSGAGFAAAQVPSNLFDQRFRTAGYFDSELAEFDIYIRSIFLQGLIFLSTSDRSAKRIKGAVEALAALESFCQQERCSPVDVALSWAAGLGDVTAIVGAESANQVTDILVRCNRAVADPSLGNRWIKVCPTLGVDLLDPRNWPRNENE